MKVTTAQVKRLANMPGKDLHQVFRDNPDTNFSSIIEKCNWFLIDAKDDDAEKLDDLKFTAGLYLQKQKNNSAVDIDVYERSTG